MIDLPLGEIKGRQSGSRSGIFGLRLDCRFELFAGIFVAFLALIKTAKIHCGRDRSRVERLSLPEISFRFAEGPSLLLKDREIEINLCLAGL